MKTRIDIDTRTFIRFWLVVFGISLFALMLYMAQTALIILGIAFFLALALNEPVSRISRSLPGKSRVGATAIAYTVVIGLLGAVIFLVLPVIVQQTAQFAQKIPEVVQTSTEQWSSLRNFVDEYNLQSQLDTALESMQTTAGDWAGNIGQNVVSGIGSVFSFLTALVLVLVLTFLMLIEGPEWMKRIWGLYSDRKKADKHRRVSHRMYTVVSSYVNGQLTVSTIGATAAGLFVFILSFIFPDVPSSLAIPTGAITFVLSLIPMFGATIGGVMVSMLIALNSIPAAVVYAVYFVIYQQIENNFIAPHIQAKRIDLTALMVLSAVTIGLYTFGVVGGIIAIPIAGSIRVLVEEYLDKRRAEDHEGSIDDSGKKPSVKLASK